jgi:ATP-dependent helicase/nuclease subunit B
VAGETQYGTRKGRIFSIAPGMPFLKTLAEALVDGRLIEGFRPADDPLLLPTATVYLPTRRAARVFSGEIVEALGGKAALMPVIRTLGDSDEEEFDLAFPVREAADLPPAAGALERQFRLATLVRGWSNALSVATRELFGDEDIVLPSSASDALKLAGDLARLIDQMETEEVAWEALGKSVDGEYAAWWDLTATFLKIVAEAWPDYLREEGRLDPAEARRRLLDLRTRYLMQSPSGGPVIAAGSTGSIPATARLLDAISHHERGAIVLPGVDFELSQPIWRQLRQAEGEENAPILSTHPQYGLARLLGLLGIEREAITPLGEVSPDIRARQAMLSLAMLPAPETGRWQGAGIESVDRNIAIIEAPGEREEALAIAIALRAALETPGKTAALTTPDRALARRVAAELERWGIQIDNSAGTPLDETPAGRFALLLAVATAGPINPVTLTAFLKDPRLSFGLSRGREGWPRAARQFELTVLRGALFVPAPGELEAALTRVRGQQQFVRSTTGMNESNTPEAWEAMAELARHVDAACQVLNELQQREDSVPLASALGALRVALARLTEDPEGIALMELRGGRELIQLFDSFDGLDDEGMTVPMRELPSILHTLMRNITSRETRHPHPRLNIWGPLEARLQGVDLMVLGGLNEGSWPTVARNDPFLNRPMRGALGLSFPERRIGQAAHDFEQLSGAAEVIYARALKADNAPTVASRWLQRLMAVSGKESRQNMLNRGQAYLDMAHALDAKGDEVSPRANRPCPRPAVELRPTNLSVTEIETWIRDPYAIHAKHILGLRPLEPLERAADPALRGTVYHEALARFVRERPQDETQEAAFARLRMHAESVFAKHAVPREVAAGWLPRFLEIARLFIEWETDRLGEIERSLTEVDGETKAGDAGFMLRGRADRIDLMRDGTAAVLDYKTGANPSAKQARIFSPQLSLEGAMAERGAFGPETKCSISDLAFVRLRAGDTLRIDDIANKDFSVSDLTGHAWTELEKLVAAYRQPEQGYLSRYAVMREGEVGGDYDHLARVREWSLGETEDDG